MELWIKEWQFYSSLHLEPPESEFGSGGEASVGEPVLATAAKMEARAKRFNMQTKSSANYDDIIGLYNR